MSIEIKKIVLPEAPEILRNEITKKIEVVSLLKSQGWNIEDFHRLMKLLMHF